MDENVSGYQTAATSSYSPIKEIINLDKAIWNEYAKGVKESSTTGTQDKKNLVAIIENLRLNRFAADTTKMTSCDASSRYGDTSSGADVLEATSPSPSPSSTKPSRKRRQDRLNMNNNGSTLPEYTHNNNNNNNHVKHERLSPGTPDTSSRSRSVTPSPASHPNTPPAADVPMLPLSSRNYSDFIRSLAAKYQHANPNEYMGMTRNGFPPIFDPRFKSAFSGLLPASPPSKEEPPAVATSAPKKSEFPSPLILPNFPNSHVFPKPDLTSTNLLFALWNTAKEEQNKMLLKTARRQDVASPLDLSSAAVAAPAVTGVTPPLKRSRKAWTTAAAPTPRVVKRNQSESPMLVQEDVAAWTVEDVCGFVGSIENCAEYVQNFREQRIDGAGLPLLTEEHLTSTIGMKLGPALKLRSVLAKKLGTCGVCLHCTHCHAVRSPELTNNTGNSSDSGGGTS